MRTLLIIALLCTVTLPAHAKPTLHDLVGVTLRAHLDLQELNARQLKASTRTRLDTKYLTRMKKSLESDEVDHVTLSRHQRQIMRKDKALRRLQAQTQDAHAIATAEYELKLLAKCYEAMGEPDAEKRKQLRQLATLELEQAAKHHARQRAEFEAEYAQFVAAYNPHKRALERAMRKLIHRGKGELSGDREIKARASEGGVETTWSDDGQKRLAHLLIRFKSPQPLPMNQQIEYLDGKYPIMRSSPSALEVWAGHARLVFRADSKTLRGEHALRSHLKQLVDLDALAAITPVVPDRLPPADGDASDAPDDADD